MPGELHTVKKAVQYSVFMNKFHRDDNLMSIIYCLRYKHDRTSEKAHISWHTRSQKGAARSSIASNERGGDVVQTCQRRKDSDWQPNEFASRKVLDQTWLLSLFDVSTKIVCSHQWPIYSIEEEVLKRGESRDIEFVVICKIKFLIKEHTFQWSFVDAKIVASKKWYYLQHSDHWRK